MPVTTSVVADLGFVGLTVVFDRRNEITPALAIAKPRRLAASARGSLPEK
jgi:hypothetical protein